MEPFKISRIKLICLLVTQIGIAHSFSQSINYEQLAFDFFINELYEPRYEEDKKLQIFQNIKEEITQFDLLNDCFEQDQSVKLKMIDQIPAINASKNVRRIEIPTLNSKVEIKKRYAIKSWVYAFNKVDEFVYVRIDVYKRRSFTEGYFIKMSLSGEILGWCKSIINY
ncbi:MAG: hypothetical protein ABIM30_10090 [candidate division WOR-3 bacterium]